jgi:hypothetical protein
MRLILDPFNLGPSVAHFEFFQEGNDQAMFSFGKTHD